MNPTPPVVLTEVRRDRAERRFRLTWNDGLEADLAYADARGYCPCAMCQGHGNGVVTFRPPEGPVYPDTVEAVGHYAISIGWSDGHATGIFRFDYLRRLAELCRGDERPEVTP